MFEVTLAGSFLLGWALPRPEIPVDRGATAATQCQRVVEGQVVAPPVALENRYRVKIQLHRWSQCITQQPPNQLAPQAGLI